MNIIVLYLGDLLHCPPAMSLGKALNDLGHHVDFITYRDENNEFKEYFMDMPNVTLTTVGNSNVKGNPLKKFFRYFEVKKDVWKVLEEKYKEDSLVWIVSNGTLKYLGRRITKKRYILHLLELTEELYFVESLHLLPLSRDYARCAKKVVECEYNRSHITQAWWELKHLPAVLENKPYNRNDIGERNQLIYDETIRKIIDGLKGKKIILYQGNISKERPLDLYIEAVKELGNEYAFVAMVNGDNPYKGESDNYYYIPFVKPPHHLEITSHAYIGILSYTPVKNSYSILNTLYCAPNKIWEYSKFGVPMISNDLPALRYHFEQFGDGISIKNTDKINIMEAIKKIDNNYDLYSENSKNYYDGYNYKEQVELILNEIK